MIFPHAITMLYLLVPKKLYRRKNLMKQLPLTFTRWMLISSLMVPGLAFAKTWGLGAVIGAPTGLSANYFLSESRTVHTTLAYDLSGDDAFQIASHYQWRMNDLNLEKLKLGWFYGVGARLAFKDHDEHNHHNHDRDDDKTDFGPSGTIGIFHEFTDVPLEVFLKGNLTVNIISDTDVDADGMLGLHYNF
jgi:hypothetical protein